MKIDVMTAMAASITVVVILGCQLLFFWSQDRRSSWLAWLTLPFLLGAAGMALLTLRWRYPGLVTIEVAFSLLVASFGMLWQGLRIFERRKPLFLVVLGAVAAWYLLCLWPAFVASLPLRVTALSALVATFCGLSVLELWRGRGEALPSRLPLMVVLGSYMTLQLVRIALVGVAPYPFGGQPADPIRIGAFNALVFIHLIALAVLMISMTKERRELEQRTDAMTDPLTGLSNRRAFGAQSQRLAYRGKFGCEQTSVLALDLDHFKTINDRYGHDTGDKVLVAFAGIAEANLRSSDSLYRIGGEEFCFVLPDASLPEAIAAAERIRTAFEFMALDHEGEKVRVTVSIGIATTNFAGFDLEVLLAAADAALYEAKARGRNRVVVAEPTAIPRPTELLPRRLAG